MKCSSKEPLCQRRREEEEQWNLEHCSLARNDPNLVQDDVVCRRPNIYLFIYLFIVFLKHPSNEFQMRNVCTLTQYVCMK